MPSRRGSAEATGWRGGGVAAIARTKRRYDEAAYLG